MIWIFLACALVLSFLLSGMESAVLSVSRVRLLHQAKSRDRAAIRLQKLFEHRDRLLSAILLLNNTLNILVFAVTTKKLVDFLGPWGYAVSIVVSLPIYLLWLELFPKSLFKRFPYRALRKCLPLLQAIFYLLGPFMGAGPFLARLLRRRKASPGAAAREEFRSITNIIEREGRLGSREKVMIQSVLDFSRVTARDVMIPLSEVTTLPLEMPVEAAVELARKSEIDQFPVVSANGEFVGIFDVFEVLRKKPREGRVVHFLNRLVRTQPGEKALTIVRRLRRSGIRLAAVYDPQGQPLGIVSTADLLRRMLQQP